MRPIIIAGAPADSAARRVVVDPWSGDGIEEVPVATAGDVERAIACASDARDHARRIPTHARAAILRRVADHIGAQADALAQTLSAEAGKPIDLARGEVARAQQTFSLAADEVSAHRGDTIPLDAVPGGEGRLGITRRFPAGVVAAITPFNFPLNLVAHKLAPAIAAGCPIVIKPADQTPLSALALGEIVLEAGWPAEALSVLVADIPAASQLVTDPRVTVLSFTGSDTVGWSLKAQAGKKKVLLELGGDAAVIVTERWDDWDAMVDRITFGSCAYAGQVCISVQRIFAHQDVAERLVEDLVRAHAAVRVGPPRESGVVMSGVIDDRAAEKVCRVVDETEGLGGRRLCGGHRDGRRFDPMVFVDVPDASPLAREEVFGPVCYVQPYAQLADAIDRVNQSRFGLQAGIYSHDLRHAQAAYERLEVGAVVVGDIPTWRADHMPYGGVKDSGFGREGLRDAIDEYTEPRLMVLPTG